MSPTKKTKRGFDLLAPHYRWMERVLAGSKLQQCRTKYLHALTGSRKILLLGEGHGRFLCELVQDHPAAQVTCLDNSLQMLNQARRALHAAKLDDAAVNFLQADVLDYPLSPGAYDAVVTHFFLDCFRPDQLQVLIDRITRVLSPGGVWLLADFRLPERGLQRWRAQALLKTMYIFFRTVTSLPARRLTNPDPLLQQNGLTLMTREMFDWGLLHTDLWRKAV